MCDKCRTYTTAMKLHLREQMPMWQIIAIGPNLIGEACTVRDFDEFPPRMNLCLAGGDDDHPEDDFTTTSWSLGVNLGKYGYQCSRVPTGDVVGLLERFISVGMRMAEEDADGAVGTSC
jgi:hypothetical protein